METTHICNIDFCKLREKKDTRNKIKNVRKEKHEKCIK